MRSREDYVEFYINLAKRLGMELEIPTQQITKTAEAAWDVETCPVEPGDEPAERSPPRRKQ